eukprot:Sro2910_g340100.2  (520) ;mRNA; f:4411-5971
MPSLPKHSMLESVKKEARKRLRIAKNLRNHTRYLWPIGAIVVILGILNYGVASAVFRITDNGENNKDKDMLSRALLVKQQVDCSERKEMPPKPPADEEDDEDPDEKPMQYFVELSQIEGHDKERILSLLSNNARIEYLSEETYHQLPSWGNITSMYGVEPRLMNHDQCEAFNQGTEEELARKFLAVAGMFNTGTNLLEDTLRDNCVLPKKQKRFGRKKTGMRAQVPYGKHTPPKDAKYRKTHPVPGQKDAKPENVMPAIMVRDPFRWLQSMCVNYYTSRWPRPFRPTDHRYHCPNLYPTDDEKKRLLDKGYKPMMDGDALVKEKNQASHFEGIFMDKEIKKKGELPSPPKGTTPPPEDLVAREPTNFLSAAELQLHHFPTHVVYANFTRYHYSLVHLFNEWYREYFELRDYPHVFLRFEDLIYFPDKVVAHVCECAGGKLRLGKLFPVRMATESQKQHHKSRVVGEDKMKHTGYLDAIIKYGKPGTRFRGMTPHDLQYANRYLDKELMDLFGYSLAPLTG